MKKYENPAVESTADKNALHQKILTVSNSGDLAAKKRSLIGKYLRTSQAMVSLSKYSIHCALQEQAQHFFMTLRKISSFIFMKILIPSVFFSFICLGIIFLNIYLNDYCFSPSICLCKGWAIYIYTISSEFFQLYSTAIIMGYYSGAYVTKGYYGKKSLQILSFVLAIFNGIFLFFLFYPYRDEDLLIRLKIYNCMLISGFFLTYVLILGIIFKDFNKAFLLKLFLIFVMLNVLFWFHVFFIKARVQFYIYDWLKQDFAENKARNIIKLVLLFYNILYTCLGNYFLYKIFKEAIKTPNISLNIIIFFSKYLSIGTYSVKTLNILTTDLIEGYTWVSFFIYVYCLVCTYTNINPLRDFLSKVSTKFKNNPTMEQKAFNDLKAGTILEANVIIALRVFSFKILSYFFIMSKNTELFSDCSRKAKNFIEIFNLNLIILSSTQCMMIMGIFIWMIKKRKIGFNLQVEDAKLIQRFFIFISMYSYVDSNLQNYTVFNN